MDKSSGLGNGQIPAQTALFVFELFAETGVNRTQAIACCSPPMPLFPMMPLLVSQIGEEVAGEP